MKPFKMTEHELGGKIRWYKSGDRVFSVLGDGYPHAEDYELHERDAVEGNVVPFTERRFDSLDEATGWIASI